MSTVIDSLEVMPVVAALPESVDEATVLLDAFIEKFLGIADFLEIKSEEAHTYGKFVYVGEKGKDFSIMAIGNPNHASYYKNGLTLSRINTEGKALSSGVSPAFINPNSYLSIPFNTSKSVSMKYLKTSKGMVFGFYLGTDEPTIAGVLSPMVTEGVEGEFLNYVIDMIEYLYMSYIPHAVFDNALSEKFPTCKMRVPNGKRALADIYVSYDNSFPYLKLFSTYFTSLKKFEINGKKYAQVRGTNGYWSLVMEID